MSAPKKSFFGFLSEEGRLNNLWITARDEKNPEKSLILFRQLLEKFKEISQDWSHYWIDFINDFLDPSRLNAVSEGDFASIEELLVIGSGQKHPPGEMWELWKRFIQAFDARKEKKKAIDLLTRIYTLPSYDPNVKAESVRELATRAAQGDAQFDIYVDYLKRSGVGLETTEITNFVKELLDTNFESDSVKIKRSGKLAKKLVDNAIAIQGVHRASGISALIIDASPKKALPHFKEAIKEDPHDILSKIGCLSCFIQLRDYTSMNSIIPQLEPLKNPLVEKLISVSQVSSWLDFNGSGITPPVSSESLVRIAPHPLFGNVLDQTLGRLLLVEGDPAAAYSIFRRISNSPECESSTFYYLLWSAQLAGEKEIPLSRIIQSLKGTIPWFITAQMLDIHPEAAGKGEIVLLPEKGDAPYRDAIRKRVCMIGMLDPDPDLPEWSVGEGTPEDELEAYRTELGFACYQKNPARVRTLLSHNYFHRLPRGDRLVWDGICALLENNAEAGCTALKNAAETGYQRPRYLLGIYLASQGNYEEGEQNLGTVFTDRSGDIRRDLVRSFIDSSKNRFDEAVRSLGQVSPEVSPRIHLAIANLYIRNAESACNSRNTNLAHICYDNAIAHLNSAIDSGSPAIANDSRILLAALHSMDGTCSGEGGSLEQLCTQISSLDDLTESPWLDWMATISWLWEGSSEQKAIAEDHLKKILHSSPTPDNLVILACAKTILFNQVADPIRKRSDEIFRILDTLSENGNLKGYIGIRDIIRKQSQLRTMEGGTIEKNLASILESAKKSPQNGHYALFVAGLSLQQSDTMTAHTILDSAGYADPFIEFIGHSISCMIRGELPDPVTIVELPRNSSRELNEAYQIIRSLIAFKYKTPHLGYELLNNALALDPNGLQEIISISRFLPGVCASAVKGGDPPEVIVQTLRQLAENQKDQNEALILVRCAGLIGDHEYAIRLWEDLIINKISKDSPIFHEYLAYLCFLSCREYSRGQLLSAAEKLEKVANHLMVANQ